MKIFVFNRFFHPDTSATSQIASDLAFHLAGDGHEVHAVTSRVDGGHEDFTTTKGVAIHRVATAATGPHSLFERGMAYLQYYRGARRAVRELVRQGDIVVAKTDPPLLSAAIGPLAHARGAKVVAWLQDVFPEVAYEYGVPGIRGPVGATARRMRDRSLATADSIVAIGDLMAGRIRALQGVHADRVTVIHNWADGDAIHPVGVPDNPLRKQWGLSGKFVVGYSGNLGRVHEFETLLDAAARLKDDSAVVFSIIGRGPRLREVEARVKRDGLANVRFEPHQPREMLAASLGVADVHVSVLEPRFEGLVHPSKLYGIMAAGRPTIFVGDPDGESSRILANTKSGVSIRTGDGEGLANMIRSLRDDPASVAAMGGAARCAFDAKYDLRRALQLWESLLETLVSH